MCQYLINNFKKKIKKIEYVRLFLTNFMSKETAGVILSDSISRVACQIHNITVSLFFYLKIDNFQLLFNYLNNTFPV